MSNGEIKDSILETAKGPQSVTADGQTVVAKNVREQIEADQYTNQKPAALTTFGLRSVQLRPPGTG